MGFGKPPSPMANHGRRYTKEDIERAIDIKAKSGMSWQYVARIMGRSPDSLMAVASRYQKGMITFVKVHNDALAEQMAQEIIEGASMSATARKHGRVVSSVHLTLRRIGWDWENLMEARRDHQKCSSTTTSSKPSLSTEPRSQTEPEPARHRSSDTRCGST